MQKAINIIGRGVTDPHIKIFGNRAYLYASHDYSPQNDRFIMRDWQIWSSADLLKWDLECTLKPEDTYIGRAIDGCWATDAVERDGLYYWAFSEVDEDSGLHQVGMVVGDTPTGPWKDVLGKPLLQDNCANTAVYDPCFFKEDDGEVYILFGVWDYYIAKMSADMRGLATVPERISIINPQGPYGSGKTDDKVYLHKRNGIYYLSWGSYYATSRALQGPYTFKGCFFQPENIEQRFLKSTWPHGPTQGRHGSFFEWDGQWYFTYCEMAFSGNRYYRDFWVSYAEFDDNGDIRTVKVDSQAAPRIKPKKNCSAAIQ